MGEAEVELGSLLTVDNFRDFSEKKPSLPYLYNVSHVSI